MPPKSNQIALAIEIIRLLGEKERSRTELADLLTIFLETRNEPLGDIQQKVDRTIRKLRNCGFEISCAPSHPYRLKTSHFPIILSSEQKKALSLSASLLDNLQFSTEAADIRSIKDSLEEYQERDEIATDFNPPINYSDRQITEILQQLKHNIKQQCRFTINYKNTKEKQNLWDLDRSELRLHDGTIYLFSYVPNPPFIDKNKKYTVENNYLFRIDRILNVNVCSSTQWFYPFPTIDIEYRLSGPLSNYKPRRKQERIKEKNEEGVIIETTEDYLFWFRQRILKYGANVEVLTPEWFRNDIKEELKKAYDKYIDEDERSLSSLNQEQ